MGDIVSGVLGADAASHAADTQANALAAAQKFTYDNLDPAVVNAQVLKADKDQAAARLALQKQIDPNLAAQRGESQALISKYLAQMGGSSSDAVAAQAAKEALAVDPNAEAAKNRLIDQALIESKGVLPPDIQAQLMQSGLEQAGQNTGVASARGAGGTILQQMLGQGSLQLQQHAAGLLTSASNLDAQRQQVLQGLFPKLQQQQMSNLAGASGILQQSNTMLPQAGLSGSDVANIWLARVGANAGSTEKIGAVQGQGQLASGLAMAGALGSATSKGASLLGSITGGIL